MRTNSPDPGAERRLIFLLNVAQRRLQRFLAGDTQRGGVTAAQSGLLFVLGKRDGVPMGEAGAALADMKQGYGAAAFASIGRFASRRNECNLGGRTGGTHERKPPRR